MPHCVFVSGSTGFLGRSLVTALLARGHSVRSLARPGSASRVPVGAALIPGDPLRALTFEREVPPADTYIHLTGTSKPAPWKGAQFRAIDKPSLLASVQAAQHAAIRHFIYVSVAQPAPIMKAYIEVRRECEQHLLAAGLPATIVRPWYVLGPTRFWPLLLKPFYAAGEALGLEGATRLGLVTLAQMTEALAWAVENPGTRVLDVPAIRKFTAKSQT